MRSHGVHAGVHPRLLNNSATTAPNSMRVPPLESYECVLSDRGKKCLTQIGSSLLPRPMGDLLPYIISLSLQLSFFGYVTSLSLSHTNPDSGCSCYCHTLTVTVTHMYTTLKKGCTSKIPQYLLNQTTNSLALFFIL